MAIQQTTKIGGLYLDSSLNYNSVYSVSIHYTTPSSLGSANEAIFGFFYGEAVYDQIGLSNGTGLWVMTTGGSGGTTYVNLGTVAINTKYHVTMVRTATNSLRAYLNGSYVGTVTTNVSARSAAQRMIIFGYPGSYLWYRPLQWITAGLIANIKIWTAALSDAEVWNDQFTFRPVKADSLWAWYPLVGGR